MLFHPDNWYPNKVMVDLCSSPQFNATCIIIILTPSWSFELEILKFTGLLFTPYIWSSYLESSSEDVGFDRFILGVSCRKLQ